MASAGVQVYNGGLGLWPSMAIGDNPWSWHQGSKGPWIWKQFAIICFMDSDNLCVLYI